LPPPAIGLNATMMAYEQKITFGAMRATGVRDADLLPRS
jgi:hypothetical protein